MAFSRDWEESNPAGTEDASLGDNRIRNLKVELGERLEDFLYGFNISDGAGDESTVGVKKFNFKEQSSIATPPADQITLAAKEAGGKAELFIKDEDGNEFQITSGGKLNGAVLKALSILAGSYAADSIDEDDIQLANDAALTAKNQAGDGTVNLISAGTNDLPTLPDSAEMASDAAPTEDEGIANKKFVDDKHIAGAIAISQLATGGVQIKTGTYTGNGSATKAITGVGFQPAIVWALNNEANVKMFLKTNTMGLNTAAMWLNGWYSADYIISLDADGFTVGDGTPHGNQLNANGKVYSYIAIGIN